MRRLLLAAALLLATPALAEEASGCGGFKWNLDSERALLLAEPVAAGEAPLDRGLGKAVAVALKPFAEATLAMPPERAPRDPDKSYAGSVSFAAGDGAAPSWRVSLSEGAWVDVIQAGAYVKSEGFTGSHDCAGLRKSVEFAIGAAPFTVQLSGAPSPEIRMVLTPAK